MLKPKKSRGVAVGGVVVAAMMMGTVIVGLGGCEGMQDTSPPESVPGDDGGVGGGHAEPYLVEAGIGELRYRAPADGRMWVENRTRGYQIISRSIKRNDEVRVRPAKDEIEVNGQTIYGENLEKNHEHGIYFRSGSGGGWGGGGGGHADYGGIPSGAERVASGHGTVRFRADSRGTVWIGNDKLKQQITSTPVQRGDEVEVSPESDQVKLNGRVIFSQNLESKHQHSIFFK